MPGPLHIVDWAIVLAYIVFAIWVGARFAKRAGENVEEYFLSGRRLPWYVAGTSMVATSFAADTPLAISGWVREYGIWKNWAWWCFAINGVLQVFLFSRWWRRGNVMTKAELVELRYGDRAQLLRGLLGILHATVVNTIIMSWVLLAATKILGVLFEAPELTALVVACLIALVYSWFAGFWGVVVTDMVQFAMAMVGAVALAVFAWNAIDGAAGIAQATADGVLNAETLSFLPPPGPGGVLDASFWTVSLAAAAVYLGFSWWASESVDGSGVIVQRICASRDDRQGMLGVLWYNVAHYALRPWCWILVGLASLLILPRIELTAPSAGTVIAVEADTLTLEQEDGSRLVLSTSAPPAEDDWAPSWTDAAAADNRVEEGEVLARTDPERAYIVMARRFLPLGLLGLVAASLLAAFMSTIDTHVNLASSFFVNDVYRRFLKSDGSAAHYVAIAKLASVAALAIAGIFAWQADSIVELFLFFWSLLGGVGPIYVLRWLWWRIRPGTEVTAMLASLATTLVLTFGEFTFPESALTPGGAISPEGRLVIVVGVSLTAAALSLVLGTRPDPRELVPFYSRVRPIGWWGPVRALCTDVPPPRDLTPAIVGSLGGFALIFGATLGLGYYFLGQAGALITCAVLFLLGLAAVAWALARMKALETPQA